MKIVPTAAAMRPKTGQREISALATKDEGASMLRMKMSSTEQWLATRSRPSASGVMPHSCARASAMAPVTSTRMPSQRKKRAAQRLITRPRRSGVFASGSSTLITHRQPST